MFTWKKLGRFYDPSLIKDKKWMNGFSQSASTIEFDNFLRIYFACRSEQDKDNQFISYQTYIDVNKTNFSEIINVAPNPILPLGERGTFDEHGTNPSSVIKFENEIYMYYCGWSRCESVPFNAAIGVAKSNDNGNTFVKFGKGGPVLSFTPNEPFLLGSPKIKRFNNKWYLFYAAGIKWKQQDSKTEPVYKLRMAISTDGINWKKNGQNIIENLLEEDECQASGEVFYYEGTYHMFFSYRNSVGYREIKNNGYRIGYANSKDLINWQRNDSNTKITVSDQGWDSEMISYPHIFEMNQNIYMIYQGNNFGKTGLGIAILEK